VTAAVTTPEPQRSTSPAARRRRLRRALPVVAVGALFALLLAGLAVAPARSYLTQRQEMADADAELRRLQAEVDELGARLAHLRTDAAVQRIAREHYDLVFPGEESYRILPAAGS
jgi:cell division protein FtsB